MIVVRIPVGTAPPRCGWAVVRDPRLQESGRARLPDDADIGKCGGRRPAVSLGGLVREGISVWTTSADPVQAYPSAASSVLAWPDGLAPPALPTGCGGIAVRCRSGSKWVAKAGTPVRNVGVDGRPLWHGWGRMIAVVPPGDHLVEVRGERSEAARLVAVEAGDLIQLEYGAPRGYATIGVLGESPVPDVGTTTRPWVIWPGLFAFATVTVVPEGEDGGRPIWLLAALATCLVALVLDLAAVRRRDTRRRRAAADLSRFIDSSPDHVGGFLLGRHDCGTPPPGSGEGGLLLMADLVHELWLGGERETRHEYAWLGPPRLRIDGVPHVAAWSTTWYPLDPGDHEIEVRLPVPPVAATQSGANTWGVEPVTLTARIGPADTCVLAVRATTRIDTVIRQPGASAPRPRVGVRDRLGELPEADLAAETIRCQGRWKLSLSRRPASSRGDADRNRP